MKELRVPVVQEQNLQAGEALRVLQAGQLLEAGEADRCAAAQSPLWRKCECLQGVRGRDGHC